jgi:hypothetical protein
MRNLRMSLEEGILNRTIKKASGLRIKWKKMGQEAMVKSGLRSLKTSLIFYVLCSANGQIILPPSRNGREIIYGNIDKNSLQKLSCQDLGTYLPSCTPTNRSYKPYLARGSLMFLESSKVLLRKKIFGLVFLKIMGKVNILFFNPTNLFYAFQSPYGLFQMVQDFCRTDFHIFLEIVCEGLKEVL